VAAAWRVLHDAARTATLASTGPYDHIRHPQYDGLLIAYAATVPGFIPRLRRRAGGGDQRVLGLDIELPHEQQLNPYLDRQVTCRH
jgi:protein-S-isoprenylcysteine O-methyltransferase Ste14